jgi:hypothetical protein
VWEGTMEAGWMVLRCGSDKAGTALLRRHALIAGISQTLPSQRWAVAARMFDRLARAEEKI